MSTLVKQEQTAKPWRPPMRAIRAYCVWCCGGDPRLVAGCTSPKCALFDRRLGRSTGAGALKAIRARCLECTGTPSKVASCAEEGTCDLWSFRFGTNPKRAGLGRAVNLRARKRPLNDEFGPSDRFGEAVGGSRP